jgi:hypothetical protein
MSQGVSGPMRAIGTATTRMAEGVGWRFGRNAVGDGRGPISEPGPQCYSRFS